MVVNFDIAALASERNEQNTFILLLLDYISDHTAQITRFNLRGASEIRRNETKTEQNMRKFCYLFHLDSHSLLEEFVDINCWYHQFSELFNWC